jgi:hypothetical protein
VTLAVAALLMAACLGGGDGRAGPTDEGTATAIEDDSVASAVDAEADDSPDLPGEYVDLPAIYGGRYTDTAKHVDFYVDYRGQQRELPPAGGPHWSSNRCTEDPTASPPLCGPAPWGVYRAPWNAETLVHNMEHGGVVLWYNTTDRDIVNELEEIFEERLNEHQLLVRAPCPDLERETIAITAWSRRDKFPVSDYSAVRVEEFIDAHERRFNPEEF